MFYTVCASAASHLLTKAELRDMLEEYRRINADLDITGMLLYKEGTFLEVLEGKHEAVMKVINLIRVVLPGPLNRLGERAQAPDAPVD